MGLKMTICCGTVDMMKNLLALFRLGLGAGIKRGEKYMSYIYLRRNLP